MVFLLVCFIILAEPELITGDKSNSEVNPEIKRARLGDTLTLICPYRNFDSIEWFHNSEPFNNNQTSSIEFSKISASNQGKWTHISLINVLIHL